MNKMLLPSFLLGLALSPVYALNDTATSHKAEISKAQQQKAADILAVIMVIDKNEVAAAKVASEKAKHEQVKAYAAQMNEEHSKNLHEIIGLSHKEKLEIKDTDVVNTLKKKGKDELIVLNNTAPESFDKVYIMMMVKGHQEALAILDEQLMMQLENPDMKAFLTDTRAHVEKHLHKAQDIEKTLN